ncbi:MAG: DUF3597 domain-containing protein [Luteolibacter sp.]
MGLFSSIISKVFVAPENAAPVDQIVAEAAQQAAAEAAVVPVSTPAPAVDVDAVLQKLAKESGEKDLDWKKSIVDLLKILGLDSSLSARKELAKELGYSGDLSDSGTMNVWLLKEVTRRFKENGGIVPSNLV